ncbi:putative DNA-binding domain-containing protein [Dongia sp.]|uniref:HvfC/BufC family peptide modification chaperone n=1 Tax=Dongia sp. TaxID=1977262 RepID=UPI0035B03167
MPPSRDDFAAALLDRRSVPPAGLIARPDVSPASRFAVHRNHIFASLSALLQARFPAIHRLVGADFFHHLAREFIVVHPPASPVLMEYGGALPGFLRSFAPVRHLAYLPDVALLEWSCHTAAHAADTVPVDLAGLAAMAPDEMARLSFSLHPSLALLPSDFPVVSIWRTNVEDAEPQPIPADLPAESALIVRPHLSVQVHPVPRDILRFIARLQAGDNLGDAAAASDAAFDLTAALAFLFRAGAVTGYRLVQPSS